MGFGQLSSTSSGLAADARSLNALKLQAGQTAPESIKEAAKQFESLFMRELIKSMREATMKSGLLDSPGGDLGADLLDQQFSVQMSGQPGGLSDLIAQQMSRQMGLAQPAIPEQVSRASISPQATVQRAAAPISAGTNSVTTVTRAPSDRQEDFVERHSAAAAKVEAASGIPAGFMIGQAGHETGWGKSEIKMKGGAPSYNLFGIKAGGAWEGKVAEITTTEYVDGVPRKTVAKFRAYSSYEESFKDYARLINDAPRYAKARERTDSVSGYASGLQRAGYATDPAYAAKLSQAINTTLQIQRAQI
jgi:flagellar protein FlgJ